MEFMNSQFLLLNDIPPSPDYISRTMGDRSITERRHTMIWLSNQRRWSIQSIYLRRYRSSRNHSLSRSTVQVRVGSKEGGNDKYIVRVTRLRPHRLLCRPTTDDPLGKTTGSTNHRGETTHGRAPLSVFYVSWYMDTGEDTQWVR